MPPLGPDVIRRQVVIGASAISPDGERVVYTRRTVAGDRYQVDLWLVPYRGGRPRQLTHGRWSDTAPAWSPDGSRIAFLSDRAGAGKDEDADAELFLIDPDGGEAERVCKAPHGAVGAPHWSPDGRTIAFVASGEEVRFWAGEPKKHVARVIRTIDWQDDSGMRDRREHLHVVAARAGARPRQVTKGDFDVSQPSWHPSGKRIAFTSNLEADADLHPKNRIYEVAVRGGKPKELVALPGYAEQPVWSPDGRRLGFVGTDIPAAPDYAEPTLWVREGSAVRSLTAHLDIPTTIAWASDLHDWIVASEPLPVWNGNDLLAVMNRRGRDEVWRVPISGEPAQVSQGDTTISSLSTGGGRMVVTATADQSPPEVGAVEDDGRLRRLTTHGGAWLRRRPAPVVREVDAGGVPAFLFEPPGAGERTAMVLAPHGGPYGSHSPTPELDTWVLVSRGYRVLAPNIRGSCGYGRAWIEAIQGAWGGPDADDLVTAVKWAVRRRLADPARIAVMGLSYGGWAANWLAGAEPKRFCCVVSENGVASMTTAHAVSCFGAPYDRDIGYGPLATHYDGLWQASPLRMAHRIAAPILMLQGEADRICPIDDNWQLFVALRERGHDVELVLYPEEHHVMMATARPDRRVDRMERVIGFLERHCPP